MKRTFLSYNFITISFLLFNHQAILLAQNDPDPITYGHYRKLFSKIIGEERTLLIHLPSDYKGSDKNYPVLYVLDGGKEVFLQCVSMTWYLEEMAQKIPGHIIVGIQNTDRNRDFDRGKDIFHNFIEHELIPFIDSQYRTSNFKILCGQSAGSVFTFDSFLKNPDLFNAYIFISFGLSEKSISSYKKCIINSKEIGKQNNKYFFFTNAKSDPYDPSGRRTKNGKIMIDFLRESIPQTNRILYRIYDDEGHVPFPSFYDALKWLYSNKTTKDNLKI